MVGLDYASSGMGNHALGVNFKVSTFIVRFVRKFGCSGVTYQFAQTWVVYL